MQRASCPACGSPIIFANKGSLATVCGHCRSVVRREGTKLEDYGKVGEIREDASPLMIGSEGRFQGKRFQVVGRLQLRYQEGTWNEWHVGFDDGGFAWLAEAQGFYSVHRPVARTPPATPHEDYHPGMELHLSGRAYRVSNCGNATCIGAEGSLPFAVTSKYPLPFVDLVSSERQCGTLDFSDAQPRLFLGEFIDWTELELTGLREELPPDHPMARVGAAVAEKIACPSCGGGLERVTGLQAKAMHCQFCGGGIDLTTDPYRIFAMQTWDGLTEGIVPLGAKVTMEGVEFTVLAHLVREAMKWGVRWTETLLHHPHKGYRWLLEGDRHFTWVTPMADWPKGDGSKVSVGEVTCRYAESNSVVVRKVAGELYWRVTAGDIVEGTDYVGPPWMVSREENGEEISWSLGKYMTREEVKEACGLESTPPKPRTVALHQPAPQDKYMKPLLWRWFAATLLIIGGSVVYYGTSDRSMVESEKFQLTLPSTPAQKKEGSPEHDKLRDQNARFMGPFEVEKGPTTVRVTVHTEVSNSWLWFRFALYRPDDGTAFDFNELVKSYDGDGSRKGKVVVAGIPAGSYYLRIEPQGGDWKAKRKTSYTATVHVDVPLLRWPLIAFGIISLLPMFAVLMKWRFEARRKGDNS